jgi:hypothetical protein
MLNSTKFNKQEVYMAVVEEGVPRATCMFCGEKTITEKAYFCAECRDGRLVVTNTITNGGVRDSTEEELREIIESAEFEALHEE